MVPPQMAEILFRNFCAPALFFAPAPVLAVFAAGRTTGIGVDVGEVYTFAVPVYEGHSMPASMHRIELGGRDVTDCLAGGA
jgi:actin-related protein